MAAVIRLESEKEILGNLNTFRVLCPAPPRFHKKSAVFMVTGHHTHNPEPLASAARDRKVCR